MGELQYFGHQKILNKILAAGSVLMQAKGVLYVTTSLNILRQDLLQQQPVQNLYVITVGFHHGT